MWDDISVGDTLNVYVDVDGEEISVQGKITKIKSTYLMMKRIDGAPVFIERNDVIKIEIQI